MNYHLVRTDDMLNGDGLRVVLFVSGCSHHCKGCHNPETWDPNSGSLFTKEVSQTIIAELDKDYISGLTLSGGDPLNDCNIIGIYQLLKLVKSKCSNKNIWIYTGYTFEELLSRGKYNHLIIEILTMCDVLVDGEFIASMQDAKAPWVGSINQRVIDIKKSLESNCAVIYKGCDKYSN